LLDKNKIVVIIPARGGSKEIPRKNARLLAGKPLLSYAITNCLNSRYIDNVYVTTDCAVLSEIASKFGAEVINREKSLAEDHVSLDEVVVDAVNQIEKDRKMHFEIIVSVQATSPLISTHTIDVAIQKCIKEKFDTVLSVINDHHLKWGYDSNGKATPLYKERRNRQYVAKSFKETGGVVACRRFILDKKTRFGEKNFLLEISKEESLDIDDRYDWWLAEKTLSRKKICFHVLGSKKDGLGHVYRSLTLADRIMDHEVHFVVSEESDLAMMIIKSQLYKLEVCKKGNELDTIEELAPDLVINDILNTSADYMKKLRSDGIATVNFEDIGEGSQYADVVINALYEYYPYPKNGRVYQGTKYCCLRDEFLYATPKEYSPVVNNIFVLIGATDPEGMTIKILKWLNEMDGDWSITVVIGPGYENEDQIKGFAHSSSKKIRVIKDTKIVSKYMNEADIAITAAGRTVFELTSLGVPMICIASSEKELSHSMTHNSLGVISLGLWKDLKQLKFQSAVAELMRSNLLRFSMRRALLQDNLPIGIKNVLDIIHAVIRRTNDTHVKPVKHAELHNYWDKLSDFR